MFATKGFAALKAGSDLALFHFERRNVGAHDVLLNIRYCGVCHSDIHQARDEWGDSIFPMVPGHEIIGTVQQVGDAVTKFQEDNIAGVGCFVDSCRTCTFCTQGQEQYCEKGMILTYNGRDKQGDVTYGGYSNQIVVDENYLLRIPSELEIEGTAPLLCAGITTYSPLRQWGVGKGHRLAVMGLGGLGHMAVKLGRALGADVTVFSRSENKQKVAERLGAIDYVSTSQDGVFARYARKFDFMIDTISAPHDLNAYLDLLKTDGTLIVVGVPDQPLAIDPFSLILRRRRVVGSLIGGIRETQDMLDFCGEHGITSDVEVISIQDINHAYERVVRGDVQFRFVIDMSTFDQ